MRHSPFSLEKKSSQLSHKRNTPKMNATRSDKDTKSDLRMRPSRMSTVCSIWILIGSKMFLRADPNLCNVWNLTLELLALRENYMNTTRWPTKGPLLRDKLKEKGLGRIPFLHDEYGRGRIFLVALEHEGEDLKKGKNMVAQTRCQG